MPVVLHGLATIDERELELAGLYVILLFTRKAQRDNTSHIAAEECAVLQPEQWVDAIMCNNVLTPGTIFLKH
jgi:hypothetical protein